MNSNKILAAGITIGAGAVRQPIMNATLTQTAIEKGRRSLQQNNKVLYAHYQ